MQSSQKQWFMQNLVGTQSVLTIGHSKIENYHCYCFRGHFFVGRYWREIGVRVLQESRN